MTRISPVPLRSDIEMLNKATPITMEDNAAYSSIPVQASIDILVEANAAYVPTTSIPVEANAAYVPTQNIAMESNECYGTSDGPSAQATATEDGEYDYVA